MLIFFNKPQFLILKTVLYCLQFLLIFNLQKIFLYQMFHTLFNAIIVIIILSMSNKLLVFSFVLVQHYSFIFMVFIQNRTQNNSLIIKQLLLKV